MKKTNTLIVSIILLLVFAFVLTYLIRKNSSEEDVRQAKKVTESVPEGMKEYVNSNYNFKFNYPSNWNVEEKLFADYYDIPDPVKGLVVVMSNPDLPKKMYDCCYAQEEIEKYGKSPVLALLIYEDRSFLPRQNAKQSFGPKTLELFSELKAKGYNSKIIENLLAFVPAYGIDTDENGEMLKNTVWYDGCSDLKLLSVNGTHVVRFSGCGEGVVENTGALFVRNDSLVFKLEDNASEYLRLGDFDKVLESFKFN